MRRTSISALLILCVLTAVTTLIPALTATAQGESWTPPVQISGTTQSSWFPDIAISPDNRIHITWASGISRGEEANDQIDLLLYSVFNDGQWSKPNDIVNPGTGGFASRHSTAIGRDGRLHLLVRSQLRIDYMQAPWDQATSVQAWSEPRKISNRSTTYYDSLAVDSTNALHALWNESVPDDPLKPNKECPACSELFYRRSLDGGKQWSEPMNLSRSLEGSAKPQIKIGKNDDIHVVWDEGRDTIVGKGTPLAGVYRRSRDGGLSWDPPTRFTLPDIPSDEPDTPALADAPQQMTVGLFQNEAPVVVYRASLTNQVYFQFSEDGGQSWSQAAPVPGVLARDLNDTPWDSYSMVTDGAGNVHLIMSGFLSGDADPSLNLLRSDQRNRPRLLHLVWDGLAWSAPEVIATEDGYPGWSAETVKACDAIEPNTAQARTEAAKTALKACQQLERYPEWPRAAIGGNTLHLTWFTRNGLDLHDSDRAHYQVWYSSRQLDVAAVEPLPQFTPVPTTAPTLPTPTPEIVPTPTHAPEVTNAPLVDGPPAWEAPGLLMLGMAVLPVFGLIILVIVLRVALMRWRRGLRR